MEGQVQDGALFFGEGSAMKEDSFFERSSSKSPRALLTFWEASQVPSGLPSTTSLNEKAPSCVALRTLPINHNSAPTCPLFSQFLTADPSRPALRAFLSETVPSSLPGLPVFVCEATQPAARPAPGVQGARRRGPPFGRTPSTTHGRRPSAPPWGGPSRPRPGTPPPYQHQEFLDLWKLAWKPATSQRVVYWYIGVASFPNKDRELLEVLQPLRAGRFARVRAPAAGGRGGAWLLAALRPINWNAPARRWRRAAVAVQVWLPRRRRQKCHSLPRANFVRAALKSGSAAPGDPCGPVREKRLRVDDGWKNRAGYLAAKK